MSAGRASPIFQPGSPLSPKIDHLALPTQARRRGHSSRQHSGSGSLKLPGLPRFHPANFPSQNSGAANTPSSGIGSPQPPLSPRIQSKHYSEAQRQLYLYQRDLVSTAKGRSYSNHKPASPRLMPLGSPGPVTPLELEGQGGDYLLAAASTKGASPSEIVDTIIREEAKRRDQLSPQPPASSSPFGRR